MAAAWILRVGWLVGDGEAGTGGGESTHGSRGWHCAYVSEGGYDVKAEETSFVTGPDSRVEGSPGTCMTWTICMYAPPAAGRGNQTPVQILFSAKW